VEEGGGGTTAVEPVVGAVDELWEDELEKSLLIFSNMGVTILVAGCAGGVLCGGGGSTVGEL
jgi:hypothetical protein